MRGPLRILIGAFLASGIWAGCTSQLYCESPAGQCVQAGGPAEAAVTAAAASALWAGGGGCAIAGCRPPMVCNEASGLCERPRCGEHHACPAGMRCDMGTYTCR